MTYYCYFCVRNWLISNIQILCLKIRLYAVRRAETGFVKVSVLRVVWPWYCRCVLLIKRFPFYFSTTHLVICRYYQTITECRIRKALLLFILMRRIATEWITSVLSCKHRNRTTDINRVIRTNPDPNVHMLRSICDLTKRMWRFTWYSNGRRWTPCYVVTTRTHWIVMAGIEPRS